MNKNQNSLYLMITEPKVFLGKFLYFFKRRYVSKQEKRFVKHNKKVWGEYQKNGSEAEILFELTGMQSSIISYSYLSNILAKKHNAKIRAYSCGEENNGISPPHRKLYKSFNAEVVSYFLTQNQQLELEQLFSTVYPRLKTKQDVFNLAISGVWFGDLLYDFHLRAHSVPTVVINDPEFRDSLKKALYQYIYWRDYFANHNVKAINVTHCAYLVAIPLRIAIQRGISAYQCNVIGCYYMTKERLWAYTDFYDFPMQFREIPEYDRNGYLQVAKKQIDRRFAGEVGVDMAYSTKSAYTKKRGTRCCRKVTRLKY